MRRRPATDCAHPQSDVTIRIVLGADARQGAYFPLSPLAELGHALHVLANAGHHGSFHAWAVAARQALGPEGRRMLRRQGWAYRSWILDLFLAGVPTADGSWARDMEALADLPLHRWVEEWARAFTPEEMDDPSAEAVLGSPAVQGSLLRVASRMGSAAAEELRRILRQPLRVRDEWLDGLAFLFDRMWAQTWAHVRPELERGRELIRRLWQADPREFLRAALPEARPALDGVHVPVAHEHDLGLGASGFFLMPSRFAWPHTRVACDPPWPVGLSVPVRRLVDHAAWPSPATERRARRFRALGDPVRLRLLEILRTLGPMTAPDLAERLLLSPSATSRHLQLLLEAGLVLEERRSYYVFYRVDPEQVDRYLRD